MAKKNLRATSIVVSTSTALDTVGVLVVDAPLRTEAGRFFALITVSEIPSMVPWMDSFLKFLSDSYYAAEASGAAAEEALASTRDRANGKLSELAREKQTFTTSEVALCLGSLNGHQLSLVSSGEINALLLHTMSAAAHEPARQRWIDIVTTSAESSATGRDDDRAVISGTIQPFDTVVVATQSITDTLSLEELQQRVGVEKLKTAETELGKRLRALGGKVSYGLLMLRPAPVAAPTQEVTASMTDLDQHEETTASLLNPRRAKRSTPPSELDGQDRSLAAFLGEQVKKITDQILEIVKTTRAKTERTATKDEKVAVIKQSTPLINGRLIELVAQRLRELPYSARRLLLVALLFGFLFTQTLVYLADRQVRDEAITTQQQTIAQIQDHLDEAASRILFDDETTALELARSAEALIASLPQDTARQRERYTLLTDELGGLYAQLERIVTVRDPQVVVSLANISGAVRGLIPTADGAIVYSATGNLFSIDFSANTATELPITIRDVGRLRQGIALDEGQLLFLVETAEGLGLARYDEADQELRALTVDDLPATVADIALYNGRLYVLDPTQQQIFRYRRELTGYGGKTPWVSGNVDALATATGIAIDGRIFSITQDGNGVRLARGETEEWSPSALIETPRRLSRPHAPEDNSLLFALDIGSQRLISWDRESGRLVQQYHFPTLTGLRDYTIDTETNTVYLLTTSEIYATPLSSN